MVEKLKAYLSTANYEEIKAIKEIVDRALMDKGNDTFGKDNIMETKL
jgi:hypothetical protein